MTTNQFVPTNLRSKLGWTARRDAIAEAIMEEFKLVMPRDRELIRQLAFVEGWNRG